MTVVAGPGHRNSGDISVAHLFGALYVGGSGAWRFQPLKPESSSHQTFLRVSMRSSRELADEIRAACALALDLGDARELAAKAAGPTWADQDLEFGADALRAIAEQSRGVGLSLMITSADRGLLEDLRPHVDDTGWSMTLCGVVAQHAETQWG